MTEEITVTRTVHDSDLIRSFQRTQAEIAKEVTKLGKLVLEGNKVGKSFDKVAASAKKAFEETRTPLERYTRKVADLKSLNEKNKISQDTLNRSIRKSRQEYVKAGRAAQGFGNSTRAANQRAQAAIAGTQRKIRQGIASAGQFVGTIAGIGGVIGGVMLIVNTLKAEWEQLVRIRRERLDTKATVGESQERLRLNFLADKSIKNEQELFGAVGKVAKDRGVKFQDIEPAASAVLSAKGDLSNKQAIKALDTVLRISNDPQFVQSASAGSLDLAKQTGVTDFRKILGFARQTQVKARITNPAKLLQNLPSVVAAEKSLGGGSAETAAELFAFLTGEVADPTGDVSRTGSINLIRRLSEFAPQAKFKTKKGQRLKVDKALIAKFQNAKTTNERLALLQQNPELGTQFLETADLGKGQLRGALTQLVRGDAGAMKRFGDIRQGILSPHDKSQIPRFEKFARGREAAPFAAETGFKRAQTSAEESLGLNSGRSERVQALAEKALEEALSKTTFSFGTDKLTDLGAETEFHARIGPGHSAEDSLRAVLEELIRTGSARGLDTTERKFLRTTLQNFETAVSKLDKTLSNKPGQRRPAGKNLARAQ